MRRPLTARERLLVRINQAAHEALRAYWPTEIRGATRYPCPGWGMSAEPCYCGEAHTHFHTNHGRS